MCYSTEALHRLVSELTGQVTHLYLWCAGVYHRDIPPELQEEVLTTPLRSAPSVVRALQPELDVWSRSIRRYSDSGLPAPGDGPSVIELHHGGDGHRCLHPVDCDQCGRDVAATLRRIGVGAGGECIKPVLNWANVCSPEHSSGYSSNYTSFLN